MHWPVSPAGAVRWKAILVRRGARLWGAVAAVPSHPKLWSCSRVSLPNPLGTGWAVVGLSSERSRWRWRSRTSHC
eukprot:5829308-Pyramimonas_sp.AAC.1